MVDCETELREYSARANKILLSYSRDCLGRSDWRSFKEEGMTPVEAAHFLLTTTTPAIRRHDNGHPMFSLDGTMLDENGNRSIFDDVDE